MRAALLSTAVLVITTGCSSPFDNSSTSNQPAAEADAPAAPPVLEQVTAKPGVAKQGRSLDDVSGPMVTSAKAYFSVKEKVVFDIHIPKNMQLFEATNGRKPKSHDEFMRKIITEGGVLLPKLPEGHTYVYDPQRGELMVERPAATETPAQ